MYIAPAGGWVWWYRLWTLVLWVVRSNPAGVEGSFLKQFFQVVCK
jgi:hypothetical protein